MTSILIVSGSLRAGSFNTALANAAAELAPAEKNQRSHRARAMAQLKQRLGL